MEKHTEIDWLNHFNDFTYDHALTGITVTKWVESHLPDVDLSYARRKIRKVDAQEVINSCWHLKDMQNKVKHKRALKRMANQYFRRFERFQRTGRW